MTVVEVEVEISDQSFIYIYSKVRYNLYNEILIA